MRAADTETDALLSAALAAKALTTAQQALTQAQQALARGMPQAVDITALIRGVAHAIERIRPPSVEAPQITVEAPQITVAAPIVHVAAPPAPDVRVEPQFEVVLPPQEPQPAPVVNVAAPVVYVAAPAVRVDVPARPERARLPWRIELHRSLQTGDITYADLVPLAQAAE